MSLSHSPSVVTNGLVFYYDANNTKKSWKGAPTTNVISSDFDTTFETLADGNSAGFSNQLGTGNYLGVSSVRGYTSNKSLKINNGTGGTGRVYRTFSVLLGEYSSVSAWVYSTTAGPFLTLEYSGGNYNWGVDQIKNTHTGSGWELLYVSTTGTATSNTTGYYFLYPGVDNRDTYWDLIQVEKKQYPTPYVNGTRSNTQSLVDLTNNNTITVSSLTYNIDGTFSFDGINNYATFGDAAAIHNIGGTSAITVEAWVKYNSYVGNNGAQPYSVVTHKGTPWTWLMENPSNTGRIRFTIAGADVTCSDTSTHPLNTWMQWVGIYDGAFMRFYRDGVLKNSVAATGTLGTNTVAATLGEYQGTYRMNGSISSVKIYNRALPASEVRQNFSALRGRYGI